MPQDGIKCMQPIPEGVQNCPNAATDGDACDEEEAGQAASVDTASHDSCSPKS
jgi:hypothetical protein